MVAKSKPMWNVVSKTVDRSPIALGASSSHNPGTLKAQSSKMDLTSAGNPAARGVNENAASSSQAEHSDVNPNTSTGKFVAETTQKPSGTILSHHNLRIFRNKVDPTRTHDKHFVVNWETICQRSTSTQ